MRHSISDLVNKHNQYKSLRHTRSFLSSPNLPQSFLKNLSPNSVNRILFVAESLFPLGPAAQLIRLSKALAEDFEIHIAVLHEFHNCENPFYESNVKVHLLGSTPVISPFSRASLLATYQLKKLIRSIQPDIVHSWGGVSEFVAQVATQLPNVSGPKRDLRVFATELFLQPEKRFTRQLYENRFSDGFEQLIVPHKLSAQHLVENGYPSEARVIPNDVGTFDLSRNESRQFIIDELNLPSESKIAGTVAPLIARTRLKDLIWACDLLACIRDDFHFVIIGKGSQLSRLDHFASLTESRRNVHFVGEPIGAEKFLTGLDFYWHSHLIEPLPSNLLAAMATGIPAVSVYGPGTSEIIRHQETGFAVNFGARDEFARWTKYLIEQPDSAAQLAAQGQQYVQQTHAKTSIADNYRQLYR